MKKSYKLLGLILGISILSWLIFSNLSELDKNNYLSEIADLNSKYGLTETEILSKENITPYLNPFFKADTIKTDVVNIFKPKKELILKLKDEENAKEKLQNVLFLKLRTNEAIEDIAQDYESSDLIEYAEPNITIDLDETENSKENIQRKQDDKIEEIKDNSQKTENIIVAVIDSGVDINHKDLRERLVEGKCFLKNQKEIVDEYGHGTHVAGIIIENSKNSKIMPLKFTEGKVGKMDNLIKAIKYAADKEIEVINLSLAIDKNSKILKEAVDYAEKKNVIIVAAAGNYNNNKKYYPAAYENVIGVSALKKNGEKLYKSNYGEWVDFSTSAQDVYSTLPSNDYGYKTGTSQAAPIISAKVAEIIYLFKEENKKEPIFDDIHKKLEEISEKIEGKYAETLGSRIMNTYGEE
ncbi:S8 family serine peptidase [Candidatus Peregrinibacteria bacterium]|nr:S8 family serine peptidase [Candidatus Peregrinibacteria bacterium]